MLRIVYTYILLTLLFANPLFPQTLPWQKLNAPVYSSSVSITQAHNGDFYIVIQAKGVFKSTDSGNTWTEFNAGISDLNIQKVHGTADNKLFALGISGIYLFNWVTEEWINLNAPVADYNSIIMNSSGHIIIGSNIGVFRSEDTGISWQAATTGLSGVYSLVETSENALIAGATFGIYKSTDNGDTWTEAGLHLFTVTDIAHDNSGVIYANVFYRGQGIFRSTDKGETWEQLNSGITDQLTTTVEVDLQGNVFTGTSEGAVYEKLYGQESFVRINNHQPVSNVNDLYIAQDNSLYVCSSEGGLFKRSPSNSEWETSNTGLPLGHAFPLGFDSDNNFYLGNYYSGIFRSTDTGKSWFSIAPYLGGSHRFTFLAHEDQLYLGSTIEFAYFGMLFNSTDRGENWNYFHQGLPLIHPDYPWTQVVVGLDANSSGDLFAALDTKGIYRRLASDDMWHYVNSVMPDTNSYSVCVNTNDIVFAGFRDGVIYKSSDNGEQWTESLSGYQDYIVVNLKSKGNYVFAILHNGNYPYHDSDIGLYSNDNGNTWLELNVGDLGSNVTSINFYNNLVVVSTYSNQVFISSNFGKNWINQSTGLGNNIINDIVVTPEGLLYCGTEKEGMFLADLKEVTLLDDIKVTPNNYSLEHNYPNPFNPTTTIGYVLQERSNAKLTLLNAIGEEIAILIYEEQEKGYHKVEFDGTKLASGVYFYQIQAGSFIETKKMILMR